MTSSEHQSDLSIAQWLELVGASERIKNCISTASPEEFPFTNLNELRELDRTILETCLLRLPSFGKTSLKEFLALLENDDRAAGLSAATPARIDPEALKESVKGLLDQYGYPYDLLFTKVSSPELTQDELITLLDLVRSIKSKERLQLMLNRKCRGWTLEEISEQEGFTRERVRQILKPYQDYFLFSSKGNDSVLFNLFLEACNKASTTGGYPSEAALHEIHRDILPLLQRILKNKKGVRPIREQLETDQLVAIRDWYFPEEIVKKPRRTIESACQELRDLAAKLGTPHRMPKQKELQAAGLLGLRGYISREMGGQSSAAKLAGLEYQGQTVGKEGRTYWTEARAIEAIREVAESSETPRLMPSQQEVREYFKDRHPEGSIILSLLGQGTKSRQALTWPELADRAGLQVAGVTSRRKSVAYIRSFVTGLGDSLFRISDAERAIIFAQQGHAPKPGSLTENLAKALQSNSIPREEVAKWTSGESSDYIDALCDPKNRTVREALEAVKRKNGGVDQSTNQTGNVIRSIPSELETSAGQSLPAPRPVNVLNDLDNLAELSRASSDEEAIEFFAAKAAARLWQSYFSDGDTALVELESYSGDQYSKTVKELFLNQLTSAKALSLPADYQFRDLAGVYQAPKLMQKLVAARLRNERQLLNLSGTGTGKTLSAILSSRTINSSLTLIICPNSTVSNWTSQIHNAFARVETLEKTWTPVWRTNDPKYLVINHELLQNRNEQLIKRFIDSQPYQLVVIDELHQVKMRDPKTESQRHRLLKGILTDLPPDREPPFVLGMSATPVINNLREGRSLIELVSGKTHEDIGEKISVENCLKVFQKLTTMGVRMMPSNHSFKEPKKYSIDASEYLDEILELSRNQKTHPEAVEAVLIHAKIPTIISALRRKTVVLTEYTGRIVGVLKEAIEAAGYSVGIYTGSEKEATELDVKNSLEQFISRDTDILIASIGVAGTGVDGLQRVCNNVVFATLPWTSAAYEQAIGRFDREGSVFDHIDIHLPVTSISGLSEPWSFCDLRWQRIVAKRDVASAAVDGDLPDDSNALSPQKATQWILGWLRRLDEEGLAPATDRRKIRVPLDGSDPNETTRRLARYGDFSALNSRWNNAPSSTTHKRLQENPEEWEQYHTYLLEYEQEWQVIPRNKVIEHLRDNLEPGSRIADFGCGRALLTEALGDIHNVFSFDHIAIDQKVFECDMRDTPLLNNEVDAAVFSLSLMGANISDYINEAFRVLRRNGQLIIYHAAEGHDRSRFVEGLKQLGFAITEQGEIYKWHYIWATRRGQQENPQAELSF